MNLPKELLPILAGLSGALIPIGSPAAAAAATGAAEATTPGVAAAAAPNACAVRGDVLARAASLASDGTGGQAGDPLAGIEVLHAESGVLLGLTGPDGSFEVEAPETGTGEVVIEFRHADWLTAVERTTCDGQMAVGLFPRVYALEGFQVSATRLERSYETSPVRVETLDDGEIADAAGSSPSLAQAIQQLPGVGALGRDGLTSAPTIRGMGRDRSLLLFEGVRLSADRGVGPSGSFLDPFLVRDVSVVRGAAGVAYGSGAIGGVVSVGLGPVGDGAGVAARLEGTSSGDGRLVAVRGRRAVGAGWRAAGGAFARVADDYAFPAGDALPKGDALNSGFENRGGMVVAERSFGRGALRLAALGSDADDIGRPTTKPGRLDTIEEENHWLTAVRYSEVDERERTELSLGIHRPRTVNRGERFDLEGAHTRISHLENVSTDVSFSSLVERPQVSGSWLAGLDGFYRGGARATETTVRYGDGGVGATQMAELIEDGRRVDVGVFAGWKRPIGYLGEFRLAGRLDWAHRGATDRSSLSQVSPSFTAGGVFPISPTWALTSSAGRSFRAPRIQELYFQGDRPGGSRLANPNLSPETAWSLEGGVRWATQPWSAEGAVWGIAATDLIVQLPVDAAGDTLRYENESTGLLGGVELACSWRPEGGAAEASISYAYLTGENESGDPLPDIPSGELRITGSARVWRDGDRSARVSSALRAGGAKTPLSEAEDIRAWSDWIGATSIGGDEEPHPGFARWDLGAVLRFGRLVRLDIMADNVLDSRYRDRPESGAYPQAGRSYRVGLTLGDS